MCLVHKISLSYLLTEHVSLNIQWSDLLRQNFFQPPWQSSISLYSISVSLKDAKIIRKKFRTLFCTFLIKKSWVCGNLYFNIYLRLCFWTCHCCWAEGWHSTLWRLLLCAIPNMTSRGAHDTNWGIGKGWEILCSCYHGKTSDPLTQPSFQPCNFPESSAS